MKKNIFALAALLIASATMFTACSSDDNIISEQPVNPTGKYTMTVQASKGDGATTRALSLSGSTLNAAWAADEAVTVYNETKGAALTGTLTAQGSGASTTLKGELTGTVEPNDVLTLKFLSPAYNTQDGTLTGSATSIDQVCDYAEATVTVASVAGGNITTTADADFQNKQAIVKFTLKDKSTSDAINATQLVVNDGTSDYTVTPTSATDVLYVALPDISSKTLTLTATVGSDTYTYEKAGVTFQNGKYYEITVKMTRQASLGDLYYSDGTWSTTLVAGKTPIGVIAYLDQSGTDDDEITEKSQGAGHGLVLCLKNAASAIAWSTENVSKFPGQEVTNVDGLKRTENVSGYTNTATLTADDATAAKYPAAKAAKEYSTLAAPAGTTGWFLPSAQQWEKMIEGLGGLSDGAPSWNSWFDNSHTAADKWGAALKKAGEAGTAYDSMTSENIWYWSSSESSASNAVYLGVNATGTYGFYWLSYFKVNTGHDSRVRPVLAF